METNGTFNGSHYNQHSDLNNSSMDHSNDGAGGRKHGERIYASKDQNDDLKLFVGGLAWETTIENLHKYFSKYGTVDDCDIKIDTVTKKPRGFGFVLFNSADSVQKALSEERHFLDGKKIDPKLAAPLKKPERKKKLFVGGVGADISEEQVREYFGTFGSVTEVEFPEDKNTHKRLNFIFVTFDTPDEAQAVLKKNKTHFIQGRKCEVNEAVSKEERLQKQMRAAWGPGRVGGYGPGYTGRYTGYEDPNQGYGYGYGQSYDYSSGAASYGQGYGYGSQGGYGAYGDYGHGSAGGYGGGAGYSYAGGYAGGYGGGYGGGYEEQTMPGKVPVNRRAGVATHHPYTR